SRYWISSCRSDLETVDRRLFAFEEIEHLSQVRHRENSPQAMRGLGKFQIAALSHYGYDCSNQLAKSLAVNPRTVRQVHHEVAIPCREMIANQLLKARER